MVMSGKPDWSWLREAMSAPIVSMDAYLEMPEDLSRTIEVVDGMIVHCESPSENHQGIQQALVNALGEAARKLDRRFGTCHRVRGDLDVLLTEVPFHFKRPDVVLYRCLQATEADEQQVDDGTASAATRYHITATLGTTHQSQDRHDPPLTARRCR